jgi:hypothetical protein
VRIRSTFCTFNEQAQLGNANCTLAWNPGGHFQDEDKRLAAAFSWCIKALEGK